MRIKVPNRSLKVKVLRPRTTTGAVASKEKSAVTPIRKSLERFTLAMDQVSEVVLERSEEIKALRLCIILGQHMMLEGKHGVAKSMLADEVFRRIVGANIYKKQLMKGTQTDEIFGPMNSQKYRDHAIWEHNTVGHLPTAHFAFIDEVYRGNDTVLGAMMGVLNEREFVNGAIVQPCPLISAIGTTNFVTESDELEAFTDRWLVYSKVGPIGPSNMRVIMLQQFYKRFTSPPNAEESGNDEELLTVNLSDIQNIRDNLSEVEVEEEIYELFEELMRAVVSNFGAVHYLSDRRLCGSFALCLADALCSGSEILGPEHLMAAQYGCCTINDPGKAQVFTGAYERIVGTFDASRVELKRATLTLKKAQKIMDMYSDDLDNDDLMQLYAKSDEIFDSIDCLTGDQAPRTSKGKSLYARSQELLKSLMMEIEEVPRLKRLVKGFKFEKQEAAEAGDKKAPSDSEDDDSHDDSQADDKDADPPF